MVASPSVMFWFPHWIREGKKGIGEGERGNGVGEGRGNGGGEGRGNGGGGGKGGGVTLPTFVQPDNLAG